MDRDLELIRKVRHLLTAEGFELAENGSEGLVLRAEPDGLLLRWQPREILRPVVLAHGDDVTSSPVPNSPASRRPSTSH
ncbi:hypothetical protein ACGFX2_32705 [Streptomyces goshikiensis]|uniref:hypothetical protein n=1 Tax=Streptomyces goshikiensis TaxID=1942 RepID=UPI00371C2394